jgi:hypothetical protein
MATQKHFNREREGSSLFEDQCSPHVCLIDLKLSPCHLLVLLPPSRKARKCTSHERNNIREVGDLSKESLAKKTLTAALKPANNRRTSLHTGSNDTEFFHSKVQG